MTPRIQKAIDIFLDAINNNTLIKGDCTKCAVGNLVRVGMGYGPEYREPNLGEDFIHGRDDKSRRYINWSMAFCTMPNGKQRFKEKTYPKLLQKYPIIKQQIESTDFTVKELAKIEHTFERNANNTKKGMIKGLEAVVQVMLEFDECKDDVKEVFTEKAELIEV